jgi:curved DNA-binding protein CbpA/cell division protein FtsN
MVTNLYALFGLTADAHPDVIKAAYRALAKQYHPDGAGAGNPESTSKFIELQNAYDILGDQDLRAEYDATLSRDGGEEIEVEPEASIDPDEIWKWNAQEHPEIDHIHRILFEYSPALGNRFRLAVINDECANDPAAFAADLERGYFEKYFGKEPDVQALARRFLCKGNRAAAKELNLALKKVSSSDPKFFKDLVSDFERRFSEEPSEMPLGPPPGSEAVRDRSDHRRSIALLSLVVVSVLGWFGYILYSAHVEPSDSVAVELSVTTDQDLKTPPEQIKVSLEGKGDKSPVLSGVKRVALVIGNANYRKLPWLSNPDEDAVLISSSLATLGFSVTRLTDATEREMKAAVRDFSQSLTRSTEIALIFYSGHAVEVDSRNYLLPVDMPPNSSREDIGSISVSLSKLLEEMQSRDELTKIVIVDACRDNPFRQVGIVTKGLAEVVAPSNTFVAYSTAPGTLALDGEGSSKNSPYSTALALALRSPAPTIEDTFKWVRAEVMRRTNNQQVPWEGSSLTGRVSFASGSPPSVTQDFRVPAPEAPQANVIKRKSIFNLFNPDGANSSPTKLGQPSKITALDANPTEAPAARRKQIYDRIVGDQEVTGEMQPMEDIPLAPEAAAPADVVAPVDVATPADQVPKIEPAGPANPIPAPDAPTQGASGLPEVSPPPPLPIPGSDQQGSANQMHVVQLASFHNYTGAETEYSRLAKDYPSIVGQLKSQIRQTTVAGSTRYQLGLGPLPTRGDTARVCDALTAAGESDCIVRGPL